MASQFELPDQFALAGDPRGRGRYVAPAKPSNASLAGKQRTRRRTSPSDFLTGINGDLEEGEEEFTEDNLPEGYSVTAATPSGRGPGQGGGANRASVQYSAPGNLGGGFGPDIPEVPTPENSAEELDAAEDEQKKRESRKRGRASTILTGGQGLTSPAPLATATLMGS